VRAPLVPAADFWGTFGSVLCLAVPALVVWRWGALGIVIGAIVFWCVGVSSHHLMQWADPNRDVALLDGAFAVFGLPIGVGMCVVVYAIRRVWRWGSSRKPDAALEGPTPVEAKA
jgi:hypothetical protein